MKSINVFYTEAMSANSGSYSPSSGKPSLAVASWLSKFPIHILEPFPASIEQIARAHKLSYVEDILECRINNGFGNNMKDVAFTLPHTVGAMVEATIDAVVSGGFSCAPVSGFHHACWNSNGGFCTFNGLMVAALEVLENGLAKRVGILDCDMHYGNGTDNILKHLGETRIAHVSVGIGMNSEDGFLTGLRDLIIDNFNDCDVLIYQAGADPHQSDPLGGWMTTEGLMERDKIVFETARSIGLPVAWNLAGGYQRDEDGGISPVLEIHDNTMRVCLAID